MMRVAAAIFVLALVARVGADESNSAVGPSAPPRDFWKLLVRPHRPWVVRGNPGDVIIESYAQRRLGDADIARLRWTFVPTDKTMPRRELGSDACRFTHVAVTDRGLYILPEQADDAAILAALRKAPSRSSPPRAYKPTRRNSGHTLFFDHGAVCWGWTNPTDSDCDDTCEGSVCLKAPSGIVYLDGTCAPDFEIFE